MAENLLNIISLLDLDAEANGVDGALNKHLLLLIATDDNGGQQDFLACPVFQKEEEEKKKKKKNEERKKTRQKKLKQLSSSIMVSFIHNPLSKSECPNSLRQSHGCSRSKIVAGKRRDFYFLSYLASISGLLCLSTTWEEKFSRHKAAVREERTAFR